MIKKRITQDLTIYVIHPLKFTTISTSSHLHVDIEILQEGGKNRYKFLKKRVHKIAPRIYGKSIITIEQIIEEELNNYKSDKYRK